MSATSRRPEREPVLAFTSGDPAGIGPETVIGALRSPKVRRACRPLLVGERKVWLRAGWRPELAPLMDTGLGIKPPAFGRVSREAGQASFAALRLAVKLAGRGLVSGLVTAPISKEAWDLAGIPFRDHTEYFRTELRAGDAQMILCVPEKRIWCVLATRHIPFRSVPGALNAPQIVSAARALDGALRRVGVERPRLGLCGLNPHAGESGILGGEEKDILAPAVRRAAVSLAGPIAADTAWRWHLEGRLDGLVALYHDQALIPLKAAAGLNVVNWTVGLPFVRTSPGHGTGFDIAGRGRADCSATSAAADLAASVA